MRGTVAKRLRREVYGQGMPRNHEYGYQMVKHRGKFLPYGGRMITSIRRKYLDLKNVYHNN